jgi:hypothetical protein
LGAWGERPKREKQDEDGKFGGHFAIH